jgi:hypothetical protein
LVFKNPANQEKDRKILASDWLFQFLQENSWKITLQNNQNLVILGFFFKFLRGPRITRF